MKHLSKLFLCLTIALTTCSSYAKVNFSTPFVPRSQSVNAALELVGWQKYINRCDDCMYSVFTITPAWQQTFQSKQIARALFGEETLSFTGSRVPNRNTQRDILADYFGLPMDYNETLRFCPRIQNFLLDFNWYVGLFWGFYLRVHAPLVHSRWSLREEFTETTGLGVKGIQGHPEGYFSAGPLVRGSLNADILEAFKGTRQIGDLRPLEFGKINGEQSITKLSDLQFALGWNLAGAGYHVGLNVRASAPTGNKATGEFLFEPIIGDYNRWNVGGGVSTHARLWYDDCYCEDFSVYLDANITHIVKRCIKRTFDLKDKTGSRYMTAIELGTDVTNLRVNSVTATRQYTGTAKYLSSLTTANADISASVQVDAVLKLAYTRGGFSLDLGYEFWARSKEKLHSRDKISSENFALKGDAQIYGFGTDVPIGVGVAHPIVVSQSNATLFAPQFTAAGLPNTTDDVAAAVKFTNANADTPFGADDGDGTPANINQVSVANGNSTPPITITAAQINGSGTPVLITDSLIDDDSGIAKAATSHKIFMHIGYAWKELCDFDPFIGIGGSAEFAQHRGTQQNDRVCKDASAASQWSVWFKGGIAF